MEEEPNVSCLHFTDFQTTCPYLLPTLLYHVFPTLISNSLSTSVHMHRGKCDLITHSLWRRKNTVSSCAAQKLFGKDFHARTGNSY